MSQLFDISTSLYPIIIFKTYLYFLQNNKLHEKSYHCPVIEQKNPEKSGFREESPKPEEVRERRKKSPLYTSVGSRKNLLELAGTTNHILNTPQKVTPTSALSILDPAKLEPVKTKEFDRSTLRPFENSCSLSPSAKYETNSSNFCSSVGASRSSVPSSNLTAVTIYDTPTPPLKVNQFTRNNNAYRPRRKFSILREKFEDQKPRPMILKTRKNDLYENISDDFLKLRSNSIREKQERIAKCRSVPTFININRANSQELLQADENYDENFTNRRNQWSTASYQRPQNDLDFMRNQRNSNARRSMSILDDLNYDKENCHPAVPSSNLTVSKSCMKEQAPPPLRPKLRSIEVMRGSPKAYRLSTGASLSPSARIFSRGGN